MLHVNYISVLKNKNKGIYGDRNKNNAYLWRWILAGKVPKKTLYRTPLLHILHYSHSTSEPYLESSPSHDLHCPHPRPSLNCL